MTPAGQRELRHTESPLRGVRRAQSLGLRETARLASIDPAHLWRVEHGQSGLSVDSLERLARVLGLSDLAKLLTPHVTNNTVRQGVKGRTQTPRTGSGRRGNRPGQNQTKR